MVTTRSSSKKEHNTSSVISGFTDDVAATRGESTSPTVAITQPDNIDCKYSSVGGSSDDVTARGDNNPSAVAITQPQDCKYSSVGGSSDDVTARGNNNPPAVAITQPTENTDTDTILTQNTALSYDDTLVERGKKIFAKRRRRNKTNTMKEKRDAGLEYRAKERESNTKHMREKRHDDPAYAKKEANDRQQRREKNPQQEEKYANDKKLKRDEDRENRDLNKATFATTVGDMFKKDKDGKVKLNTEGYEYIPNGELGPEMAAMNMHMNCNNMKQEIAMKVFQEHPNEENLNRILEIIKGQMITPERQHLKATDFQKETGRECDWDDSSSKHSINDKDTYDAQLVACACCGVHDFYSQKKKSRLIINEIESGIRSYELIPLDNLSILKLDEKAVKEYKDQLEVYVKVPNEEGDIKVIRPWKVRSIYKYSDNYYYLHPEMVEQTNSSKCPQAAICNVCKSKIDSGTEASKITNSIASGVDFGNPDRLEVTFKKPSLREHLLMALVRPYATIIKLQNKNNYKHSCLQSAIKGSSIVFEHDSPQVVSNLLSTESMNSNMCIHFVGAKGEFDSMIKRTLDQRTADIYGRPYVIFQWLKLLCVVNVHYQGIGIEEMEFQTLKDLVDKSNDILVENHEKIIDADAQERNEQMTDDVAGIRSPPANNNEEIDNTNDSDDNLDLQYSYLATKKSTPNKDKEDSTNAYLRSAAKTIGVNLSEEEEKYNASKSYRSEAPVNEFEKGEFALVAGFPHVCLLGTAYNKKSSNLSESDCLHLLMQYTNIPATCKLLIFYLFDIKRRHQNVYGMSAKVKGDSVAFDKFVSEFSSSNFQDRLRRGVKNPSGNDAKYVLSKLMPVLVTAGKHTTLGSLERNSSVGEMLAMIRRHGSSFCFLTGTFDDVHNPNVLRLSSKHFSNTDYPSLCPTDFLDALKTGKEYTSTNINISTWTAMKEQVNGNPVASAFMYKRLVYAITKVLVGLKSSTTSGSGNRTVMSKHVTEDTWTGEDNGVIISNTDAYCGVHECSGRGALHFHICLFGGIAPYILQNGVDNAKIRNAITTCLDTMFSSQIPSNFHVKRLIEKELPHYPGGNPTIRKGRAQLIPPDPVKEEEFENHVYTTVSEEFENHVYTTVSDCGIHSHQWNSIGTCHKPPKGLTGCRMNKPDNPIRRTGPVQLKEMTRTEDELTYRVLNEIRDEGKDKGDFDIETREEAKNSISDSHSLHPLDDPDPRLITWQIASPNLIRICHYRI